MAKQSMYFIRHGETMWNREGRVQGQLDDPLTLNGVLQVCRLAETLHRLLDDPAAYAAIMSPLIRARQSAAIVCDVLGIDFRACQDDDLLKEITWGDWEGMTREEIAATHPDAWARRERDHWGFVPPKGESYAMGAERVRRWLSKIADQPRLIVIGHGAFCKVLRGLYAGLSPAETLALDEPHEALFCFTDGAVTRINSGKALPRALSSLSAQ